MNLLSDCEEKLNIKTRVELSYNPLIASPMLIAFFRPRIVLPVSESEDKELSYIFTHELIHYKQGDMFYKWLIQIVVCAHWFNPFVYLLEREVNKSCELSCDEKVISVLDDKARREYGDTLINFLKPGNLYKSSLASVTLTEGAEQLKERLGAIMNDSGAITAIEELIDSLKGTNVSPAIEMPLVLSLTPVAADDIPALIEKYFQNEDLIRFSALFSVLDKTTQKDYCQKIYDSDKSADR